MSAINVDYKKHLEYYFTKSTVFSRYFVRERGLAKSQSGSQKISMSGKVQV